MDTSNTTITTETESGAPDTPDSGSSWWNERFLSTKFLIVLTFTVVGCIALLKGIYPPDAFNWLVAIVLTGHGASNILDKRFNRDQ